MVHLGVAAHVRSYFFDLFLSISIEKANDADKNH
jgi:hypothetical protein